MNMNMIRRVVIALSLLAVVLILTPTALRTYRLASYANGLTTIALLSPNDWTLNPFSINGLFISPDAAMWLLLHTDFPYRPCPASVPLCEAPVVSFVGGALRDGSPQISARAFILLEHFIKRGGQINIKHVGLTPLHQAVLFADDRYLKVLLDAGADVNIKADESAKSAAGLTPYEYCVKLENSGQRSRICEILSKRSLLRKQ